MEALRVISSCACVMTTLGSLASVGPGILLARRRGRWQSSQATVTGHGSRYIDALSLAPGDRAKVYELNARRIYPRLAALA